jgi:hypothetical protein
MKVDDKNIRLVLKQKPDDFQVTYAGGAAVEPSCGPIQVDATCTILPDGGSPTNVTNLRLAPWKLGFMQARSLETQWSYYRGSQESDGCVINDKVSKQAQGICRDYDRGLGHVFWEGSKNPADCYGIPDPALKPPWTVTFCFGDQPKGDVPDSVTNPKTGKKNYLHEGRLSMGFVTTMTELAGPGRFVHHRHFMWTVVWHYQAIGGPAASGQGPYKLLSNSGFWISEFKRGAPSDRRYRNVLDDPTLTASCNEVVSTAPVEQQAEAAWVRFRLMDAPDKLF